MAGAVILLVEDEASLRGLLARYLERQGYSVVQSGEGTEALALFRAADQPIDLAIVDLTLPDMSGEEVMAALVAESASIKVIISSGRPYSPEALSEEIRPRVEALLKPYLPQDLLNLISNMLEPGQASIS
jgi:DNA-binding NtrC family response regulator